MKHVVVVAAIVVLFSAKISAAEIFPITNDGPPARVFEIRGQDTSNARLKARVDAKDVLEDCASSFGSDSKICKFSKEQMNEITGKVHTASANCVSGGLTFLGESYVWVGHDQWKEVSSGITYGDSEADAGSLHKAQFVTLCPSQKLFEWG